MEDSAILPTIKRPAEHHEVNFTGLVSKIKMGESSEAASIVESQPELLLQHDASIKTALHYTAECGNIGLLELLLVKFASLKVASGTKGFVNAKSFDGESPLMLAVAEGHEETALLLITNGADVNDASLNGLTALDRAAEAGYSKMAEHLMRHGAAIEKARVFSRIRRRNILLQQRQASLKAVSDSRAEKQTENPAASSHSLANAAKEGNANEAKLLLTQGADIEELSPDGQNALMLAAKNGHLHIIDLLLASGANVDATSAKGWTTLMIAVRNRDEETLKILIANGADVNHRSPDRWTALAEAAYQGQISIMSLLLQCNADTESKSSHDWTPLMHAAYKGDEAAVDILLAAGADMEVSSAHDETAMLLAAAGGHTRIVQKLLTSGCAPEPAWASKAGHVIEGDRAKGEFPGERAIALGWTPLMLACQNGFEDVAHLLLEAGVSLEPRSPNKKTALEIAAENGQLGIIKLLEKYM